MAAKRNSTSGFWKAWAGITLVLLAFAPAAFSQLLAYTGSFQFSSGDYIFTGRTNSFYLFSGLSARWGRFAASASVPLIRQTTPWVSYGGAGMIPSGGNQDSTVARHQRGTRMNLQPAGDFEESGLGDPLVRGEMELTKDAPSIPSIHLVVEAKPPLVDVNQGFGTGEWDFGSGVSLSKQLAGNFLFGDVIYWALGDLPELELKNTVFYSIAFGKPLAEGKFSLIASFSGYTEIIDNVEPPAQIGLAFTYQPLAGPDLSSGAAFGLTESSPDVSVSLGWQVSL